MPPFLSTCKLVGSIVTCQNWKWHVTKPASSYRQHQNCDQMNVWDALPVGKSLLFTDRLMQTRTSGFLGGACIAVTLCRRGGALSKVYEERRVLGYSPVHLFDVVAAVDLYQDFVPRCQRSEILKSYPDGSFVPSLRLVSNF